MMRSTISLMLMIGLLTGCSRQEPSQKEMEFVEQIQNSGLLEFLTTHRTELRDNMAIVRLNEQGLTFHVQIEDSRVVEIKTDTLDPKKLQNENIPANIESKINQLSQMKKKYDLQRVTGLREAIHFVFADQQQLSYYPRGVPADIGQRFQYMAGDKFKKGWLKVPARKSIPSNGE